MGPTTFGSNDRLTRSEFSRRLHAVPPEDLNHYELLDGLVVSEPPAGWPHGEIAPEILAPIRAFVKRRRLGRVFDSSQGFDLPGDNTVEPDVAFVSHERWERIGRPIGAFPEVVPDLIVEILSPSTRHVDRTRKKDVYERSGVREYWLVDPRTRRVTRFVREDREFDSGCTFGPTTILHSVVLHGLAIAVGKLFPADMD